MNNFARPGLGATELPPVNAEDNGKVLGVSDGAWAKVDAGGGSSGGGVLVVNATFNGEKYVADKTAAEIWASMKKGIVVFNDSSADEVWVCIHAYIDSGTYNFQTSSLEFTADSGTGYPEADAG